MKTSITDDSCMGMQFDKLVLYRAEIIDIASWLINMDSRLSINYMYMGGALDAAVSESRRPATVQSRGKEWTGS
jgi:hypothetical protein